MKILVAIESDKNAEQLAHTTLRWAARAGFDLRIFIPDRRQLKKYKKFLDEYNYYYWGNIDEERSIVAKADPMEWAKANGYDLLVTLPDNLLDYCTVENDDATFMEYAEDVAKARVEFGHKPDLESLPLERNDRCLMERVL